MTDNGDWTADEEPTPEQIDAFYALVEERRQRLVARREAIRKASHNASYEQEVTN